MVDAEDELGFDRGEPADEDRQCYRTGIVLEGRREDGAGQTLGIVLGLTFRRQAADLPADDRLVPQGNSAVLDGVGVFKPRRNIAGIAVERLRLAAGGYEALRDVIVGHGSSPGVF